MVKTHKKTKTNINRTSKAAILTEAKHVGMETIDWSQYANYEEAKWVMYETSRHYAYFYKSSDFKKWVIAYAKKFLPKTVAGLRGVSEGMFISSVGAMAKMALDGAPITENNKSFMKNSIEQLISKSEKPKPVVNTTNISPAERLKEKTSDFIGDVETVIDDQIRGIWIDVDNYSVYKELQKADSAYNTAKAVFDYYTPILKEYKTLASKKDKELVEGYSLEPKQIKERISLLTRIISDAERYMVFKKAVRSTPKPKTKSVAVKVSSLKYSKVSDEFKLVSIDPQKIVGASKVVMFDTKYRQLILMHSNANKGLDIKGTTIQNVDVVSKKRLRKPDEVLPLVQKATKASINKVFDSIKTKSSEGSSRCNENMVILKVFS